MDPSKLEVIDNWPTPANVKELQKFVGFANFYRRFINKFGSIGMPLTDLTRKDISLVWGPKQEESFSKLKSKFKDNVILQHFNWDKPARLETDASDSATSGILLEDDTPGIWKPVAFFSRKLYPAEANYEIYDMYLLAIVKAFEEWRP